MTTRATSTGRRPSAREQDEPLQHYSVEEVAEILGISRRWLAGQAAERSIRCTYIAGKLRFTAAHIRALSEAGEVDPNRYGRRTAVA
ncbi:helix-turn-helix domain-containing protein [Streptomyces sp. NBC_01356]|uniref:helix-turn-helix domain-containing protein n=1 Tax=Streptomyces sp. NBC_01356 TaxID=2903836 RepID=UPI002E36C98E|nr:helix-turn-helix domain-containing protein [Streptomyces sp. NBC_01356]